MALSQQDVDKLLKDSSPAVRQEVLQKVMGQYNATGKEALPDDENQIVESIFRTLMKSSDRVCRRLMSEKMQESSKLPKDIALHLANDKEVDIALPILRFSPGLEESELVKIVEGTEEKVRLLIIAQRDPLPVAVTEALFKKKLDYVNAAVLKNDASKVSDTGYLALLDTPKVSMEIIKYIVTKGSLSIAVAQQILLKIEGKAKAMLDEKYEVIFENKQLKKELKKKQQAAMLKLVELRSGKKG